MTAWHDPTPLLTHLLVNGAKAAVPFDSIDEWWAHFRPALAAWATPIDAALAASVVVDRVGYAFAAGYQAALRRLDATLPNDRIACLSVTEEGGGHPRAIASTLTAQADGSFRLAGHKRWATLSSHGGLALVAASIGSDERGRNRLRVARVDLAAAGVRVEAMPPTAFVPEVEHGQLHFDGVVVQASELLPGDGYEAYVKPFRTLEDLHVGGAIVAYVFGAAMRQEWSRGLREDLLQSLVTARSLALADPASAAVHLALEGWQRGRDGLLQRVDEEWRRVGGDEADRWQRDRALTRIAERVRAQRTETAWARVAV